MPIAEGINSSIRPDQFYLVHPEKENINSDLEQEAWFTINDYLGKHESFSRDSQTTRYVQSRLDYIVNGRKAEVIMVHDNSPNAFAMPGYIVLTDSILKLMDYQEELDGLLAHEWVHLQKEHAKKTAKIEPDLKLNSFFALVGRKRINEVEADLTPLELLDQRNINPIGFKLLSKKLEAEEAKLKKEARIDVEHGSLLDRRLNLEQINWLIDTRNLSNKKTPIGIKEQDLDGYLKDEDLWEKYADLDFLSKRHFLQRQFKKINTENDSEKVQKLLERQKDLLLQTNPGLSKEDMEDLLFLTVIGGYSINKGIVASKLFEKKVETKEELIRFFSNASNNVFFDLGIKIPDYNFKSLGGHVLESYLSKQDKVDFHDCVKLIEEIGSIVKDKNILNDYYTVPIAVLMKKGKLVGQELHLAEEITDLPVSSIGIFTDLEQRLVWREEKKLLEEKDESYFKDEKEKDKFINDLVKSSDEYKALRKMCDLVIQKRTQRVSKIKDPVEKAIYVDQYLFDIKTEAGDLPDYPVFHRKTESVNQQLTDFPISVVIKSLVKYAKEHNPAISSESFSWLLVLPENALYHSADTDILPYENDYERFILWAICLDRNDYIDFVKRDLADFKIKSIESLKKRLDLILTAPQKARDLGINVNWDITAADLRGNKELFSQARKLFLKEAAKKRDPGLLIEALSILPFYISREEGEEREEAEGETGAKKNWDSLLKLLLKENNEIKNVNHLLRFFALGCLSDNTQVLLQIPPAAMKNAVSQLSFNEGMNLIFEKFKYMPRHLFTEALEYLIENKAKTIEEFKQLKQAVYSEIETLMSSETAIGQGALAEALILDPWQSYKTNTERSGSYIFQRKGLEPIRLLSALLKTSQDDSHFKKYLFERWWLKNKLAGMIGDYDLDEAFNIEALANFRQRGKEGQLNYWLNRIPQSNYTTFSQIITDAYLANSALKYAILRKILVGENGVLNTDEGKSELARVFLDSWVDFGDSKEEEKTTRELLNAVLKVGNQEELYLQLNSILMDLILRLPQKHYPYLDLAAGFADEKLIEMKNLELISDSTERDRDLLTGKILRLMLGGDRKEIKILDLEGEIPKLLSLFSKDLNQDSGKPLSPWEIALTIGEKSGAVGVRMLQLAGQYFEIPEEMRGRLMNAYDGMKGQSRLQAFRLLEREAKHSPQIAELMNNIVEIHPRIGGGSLMTVYDILLKDGEREALGIKNPNVEYHVGNIVDLIQRAIRHVREQNPDDKNYQLLEVLLSDVQEWVDTELQDPNFEEKDKRFRELVDSNVGKFNRGRNRYNILIPVSIPTGTRWIRRDQYIEGKNLTSLKVTENETNIMEGKISQADFRQATSILIRSYIFQMLEAGLVHSDIHPGNFRITSDNSNIAVFDRYNLLELDDNDKKMLRGFIGAFRGGGVKKATQQILNYVLGLEKNIVLSIDKQQLIEELSGIVDSNGDAEKIILNTLISLKQKGIHVPLKISLIGKNLQALNNMAKIAGFTGLADAFKATATKTELLKLAIS